MGISNYIALSAQVATDRRMATIANNIANMTTVGFKADAIRFEAIMKGVGQDSAAYVDGGTTFLDRSQGGLNATGNDLDVAISGDAWFAVETPNGRVHTRDGRLRLRDDGSLVTLLDHPVLDPSGQPIQIDPAAGPPTITPQGQILQNGLPVSGLGLFRLPEDATLTRAGNSGVTSDKPAEPVLDGRDVVVQQGYLEQSNVVPILEMTRMIMVQRTFEAAAKAVETAESTETTAVRELGATT
ncbi:flagellar basal-body rod protein FlgF [Chthonobacter rhizosphaerae]|uniref:flagellar basal-body rod protein FlgF n=1 Tax=Chthonobacter rhizosphaerae TaxID=2735553 RepID=UPI0015EF2E7B|nr:flagellar basal-body rod protein FlgF [Chthonobacter rhizosphaerae]